MPPIGNRHRLALIALVALALIWGYNWVVMKVAVHDAPPFMFAATRALGGGIVLLLVALATRRKIAPQRAGAFFWIGIFQTGLFLGLVTWAVVSAGAGQVAMLSYTMPLWVSLFAWPFLGERLNVVQGIAIAIAFAGIACMIGPRTSFGLPEVLALAAGVSWAIGIIIAKRVQREHTIDLFNLTMWQLLFGGLGLTAVALLVPAAPTHWTMDYILAVTYNIVLATAIAYFLWIFVLDALPARDASMGTLASPLVGVVLAWLILGERPSLLMSAGVALVLAGLALLAKANNSVVQRQ